MRSLIFLIFCLFSLNVSAQNEEIDKALENFLTEAYNDAIKSHGITLNEVGPQSEIIQAQKIGVFKWLWGLVKNVVGANGASWCESLLERIFANNKAELLRCSCPPPAIQSNELLQIKTIKQ